MQTTTVDVLPDETDSPPERKQRCHTSHSVCMSIFKVCTQLGVLHLSGLKIYESHRQRSPSLSPVTCPLTLSIFSFPIISSGVSQTQLTERDGSATISLCNPLIKRIRACLAQSVCHPAAASDRRVHRVQLDRREAIVRGNRSRRDERRGLKWSSLKTPEGSHQGESVYDVYSPEELWDCLERLQCRTNLVILGRGHIQMEGFRKESFPVRNGF